jgi:hypothetical protein
MEFLASWSSTNIAGRKKVSMSIFSSSISSSFIIFIEIFKISENMSLVILIK